MKTAIYILYILVLALAGWLAYACYCNLQFDAGNTAGIIVSVLGAIIAVLIGWQVFNAIEMRSIIRSADRIKEKLNHQGLEHESKIKSLEWLISALHGETYKREDFNTETEYFLHCSDVIGCFIKSGTELNSPPFNRSLERLETTLQDIKKQNNEIEIAFMGGEKHRVRDWYHKAIYIIESTNIQPQHSNTVKNRLTNVYEDYIALTKDVKVIPQTQRRIKGKNSKDDKKESNNIYVQ